MNFVQLIIQELKLSLLIAYPLSLCQINFLVFKFMSQQHAQLVFKLEWRNKGL